MHHHFRFLEKETTYLKTDLKFGLEESFNQMKKSGYWCHTCMIKPLEHGFWCSFGHKLSHFVTSRSWPPIKKFLLQKFQHLINWIQKCYQKIKYVFIWSQIKSFRHILFLNSNKKTSFTKVSTFDQLITKRPSEKWNGCSFGHK